MGHVQAKPTIEQKTIKCPFCKEGDIDVLYTSEHMSAHATFSAGGKSKKMIPNYHPEKYDVRNSCPICKKSRQEIKDVLQRGGEGTKSHEDRLKRIRDSGLPTRIEG